MLITQAIFVNTPLKVPILIFDLTALPCGLEGQVAGLTEVDGNAAVGKVQFVRPPDLNGGLSHSLAVDLQADNDFAAVVGRRINTVRVNAAAAGEHRPRSVRGNIRTAAGRIHASCAKLHRAAGGVNLRIGCQHCVIELARGLRLRKHHNGVGHLALIAVGGAAAQRQAGGGLVLRLTLALGGKGRGAAAIQVDRLHTAQGLHGGSYLRHSHTHRIGCLAAIHHQHYHGTVRLDTDSRAGRAGGVVQSAAGVSVFKNIAKAGNSLPDIAGSKGCITFLRAGDMRRAAAVDPERGAGRLINHGAAHDEGAAGPAIAHVVATGIDGAHNILTTAGLHTLRLLGGLQHGPVPAALDGFNVIVTVAHRHRSRGALADLDLHHMPHHLLCQRCIVQDPLVLGDIRCNGIFLLRDLPYAQCVKTTSGRDIHRQRMHRQQ